MTVPLFLENETYSSTLHLVNSLNFGVDASVTLYDMSGLLLINKHYFLQPNTQQAIEIKKILSEGSLYTQAGSVEVVSPANSNALLGQLSITRSGSNPTYLDEELFAPQTKGSQTLSSVIDSTQNSPIVVMNNVSSITAQTLHLRCVPSSGASIDKVLLIQPKQTKLVRACGDAAISPEALESQFLFAGKDGPRTSEQQVAGITITSDGPPSGIAAFGFVEHNDDYGRYFSTMNFADPALLASSSSIYTGVPVGKSLLLPDTDYTPQVALTNFSSSPQIATVAMATTLNGVNDRHQVASLTIPANSSRMVPLKGLTGDPGWQNSFIVSASGRPGEVLSKMMFRGQGKLPNVELIPKDELGLYSSGDHPWTVEDGTRSTLFLFNHAASVRSVTVRIGSGSSIWLKVYDLAPGENKTISINEIKDSNALDMDGHGLADGVVNGEVAWFVSSAGAPEVTGRVVQIDSTGTVARNFSCQQFVNLCVVNPSANPFTLGYGSGQVSSSVNSIAQYCNDDSLESCVDNGQYTTSTKALNWAWSSDNTAIAQVTSGAGSKTSSWQGMSVGNTSSSVSASTSTGSCGGDGSVTVKAIPTMMYVANDPGNIQNNRCTTNSANGMIRSIVYQLTNASGNVGNTMIKESFGNLSTNSCGNGAATPSPCSSIYVTAGGQFVDNLYTNYCSQTPNNGCGFTITPDHWQYCGDGASTNLGSPGYVIDWNNITVNNSIHLSPGTRIP